MSRQTTVQALQQTQNTNSPTGGILQRKCACNTHSIGGSKCPKCQNEGSAGRRHNRESGIASQVTSAVNEALRSPGRPLDTAPRGFMESRFGRDFSQVRVHTDQRAAESARAVGALAYTVGNDIAFAQGQYAPSTHEGKHLLAHELTHVLQQDAGQSGQQPLHTKLAISGPASALEREADRTADGVMFGGAKIPSRFTPATASIQRVCGVTAIGALAGCTDQDPTFITGHPLFKFVGGCDDFSPGEEANLRTTAGSLPTSGPVEVHGYASVDGNAIFNENLSCARAVKAQSVLVSEGITAGRISIIKHGPTPGPADDRRSVVVRATAPTPTPVARITSETVETTPAPRTRTTIGVGEEVRLTNSTGSATWASTAGTLSTTTGTRVVFTAPDTARIVGVAAATSASTSVSIAFTVVAPTSVSMTRQAGSGVKHNLNRADSGILVDVFLGPDTVNFSNIRYRELDVPGVPTPGAYSCNTFSTGHCSGAVGGACPDKAMTNTVVAGRGTQSVLGDCAYSGHCGGAPPFAPGSITVAIPYEYRVGAGSFHSIRTVNQVHTLAADATTLMTTKAGANGVTTVATATTLIAQCP